MIVLEPFTPDFLCASDRKRPALGELLLDGGGGGAGMQRGREQDPLEPRVGLDASCSARNLQCAKHETQHAVSPGLASSLAVSPPACPCLGAAPSHMRECHFCQCQFRLIILLLQRMWQFFATIKCLLTECQVLGALLCPYSL